MTVDGRTNPDASTVLFFQPWSEYVGHPDANGRYRLLAASLGARVVILDNLGMGPNSSRLPDSMRRDVERGDFGGNIAVQTEALRQLDIATDKVALMGYSLGTAMAASFARSLADKGTVESIVFGEPVGTRRQHTTKLIGKFAQEIALWARDYSERRKLHPKWMGVPTTNLTSVRLFFTEIPQYMANARGLSTAPIATDMREALETSLSYDTPIRIANGGSSVISTTRENEQFAAYLRRIGYENVEHDVYDDVAHGVVAVPRKLVPMMLGEQSTIDRRTEQ
jgi:pimeloyl-ACP methyl ester carboxylesterase